MGVVQLGVVQLGVVQMGIVQLGVVQVQLGSVQMGVVQLGVVQLGVVQMGVDQSTHCAMEGRLCPNDVFCDIHTSSRNWVFLESDFEELKSRCSARCWPWPPTPNQ